MSALRKYPALLRAYFARSLEYRGIIIIWALSSVLPLVMMAVWLKLAEDRPVGGYSPNDFVAYFLAVTLTRRLVGAWVVWDIDRSIREGELSARLLRPLHPFHYDLARVLAAKPLNFAVVFPPIVLVALLYPAKLFEVTPFTVVCYVLAVLGALLIELFEQWCVGCLAFWWSHTTSLQDGWFILYSFLGGQIVPLSLLPGWLYAVSFWMPFRYMMSFPVEIIVGRLGPLEILQGFAMQAVWLLLFGALFRFVWARGVRQYSAVGA